MNDLEATLAGLLVDRAEHVEPRAGHRETTLRRARRRRLANGVTAGAASLAIVAAGLGVSRTLDGAPAVPPPAPVAPAPPGQTKTTAGDYGFQSKAGPEYPWVAQGSFRNREWELRAAAVRSGDSLVRLTLQVRDIGDLGGAGASTGFDQLGDGLFVEGQGRLFVERHDLEWVFKHEVAVVFGAATPDTHTVDVDLLGVDRPIEAHVFERYDARTGLQADYWVAFVPAAETGRVVARDEEGRELASEVIPQQP